MNNQDFKYTYSSEEQKELLKIRQKYSNAEEDKMERVRRLDRAVIGKSTALSLIVGVLGTLVFGFGMSLIMTELGTAMNLHKTFSLVFGIILCIAGAIIAAFAYPLYNYTFKKERDRVAPEILKLTDELLK